MANEIKFIFTGDTAEFDVAINKVVKKANEAKAEMKGQTEQQKTQLKLQKLLAQEYQKAAKTAGSLADIEKKIKQTQAEKVRLSKKLNDSTLDRKKRLEAIVELAKKEARLSGLNVAASGRRTAAGGRLRGMAGAAGAGAVNRAGYGGAASAGMLAGTGAVALGASAAAATGIGLIVAVALIPLITAFKGLTHSVQKAKEAMELMKTAQLAGKTVEQVQAEKLAGLFGGDAEKNKDLFKELGLIIDRKLLDSLSKSGKALMAFSKQLGNVILPLFERIAKLLSEIVIRIGATGAGVGKVFTATREEHNAAMADVMENGTTMQKLLVALMPYAAVGGKASADYIKKMRQLMALDVSPEAAMGGAEFGGRIRSGDSMARIGIFKGQRASELQILKATLEAQKETAKNTGRPLIDDITNA